VTNFKGPINLIEQIKARHLDHTYRLIISTVKPLP